MEITQDISQVILSIILPFYNNEESLEDAIHSVINQTSKQWELILIDDGSIDSSYKIAKKMQRGYDNIKIYKSKENLGPARARNIGLKIAKGSFIGFLDSDDLLNPEFVKKMLSVATKENADIVWCGFSKRWTKTYLKNIERKNINKKNLKLNSQQVFSEYFLQNENFNPIWNKIFSRKLILENKIFFNEERVKAEDWEFNVYSTKKATNIVINNDSLYVHWERDYSVMNLFRLQDYENMWNTINIIKKINQDFNLRLNEKFILNSNKLSMIEFIFRGLSSNYKEEIIKILKSDLRFTYFLKNITLKELPFTYVLLVKLCQLRCINTASHFVNLRKKIISIKHKTSI